MTTKTAALLIGVVFVAVGLLGFIENPIIYNSHEAMFHADKTHNIVHIVSGAIFLLVAMAAPASAPAFLKLFGIIYLGLGVWGLAKFGTDGMGTLLGFLNVNGNDNFLHIGLGIVIFLAGFLRRA